MVININYYSNTLTTIDNSHNLLYNKLYQYFNTVDVKLYDTICKIPFYPYNKILYSVTLKDVINPQHELTKWDIDLLESIDISYSTKYDTPSVVFNIKDSNSYKLIFNSGNTISYLKFELEIKDFIENYIIEKIKKTSQRREELFNMMNNTAVHLNGTDYREHIFKNMILPKYAIYIESEINNFFGYIDTSKKFAGKMILDDLLFANVDTLGKDNMCFTILLAMDNPEVIVNNMSVCYDEYVKQLSDYNRDIDETHYIIKIVLFPNIEKTKYLFDIHHNDRYFRKFDNNGYGDEKISKNVENKMNEFYDHIKNKMLPELCTMWNKDVDVYVIENNMDESNFKDEVRS